MADQEVVKSETINRSGIQEVIALIGFNGNGDLALEPKAPVDSAHLVVMLEQLKQGVVNAMRYKRERQMVLPATGRVPRTLPDGKE